MSLLTICQDVAAISGWPVPGAVASNSTDATARQMFALARQELKTLSESKPWTVLETEYVFSTTIGQDTYPLPSDARVIVSDSAYDTSQYFPIKGSVGTIEWNARRYGMLSNIWCTTFKLIYVNGLPALKLDTVPQEVRNLVIIYRTKNYAISGNSGDAIETYMSDDDMSRVPEGCIMLGLMWRFRRAKGLDFSAELAEYNTEVNKLFSENKAQADIPIGRRWLTWNVDWPLTSGYVPDSGFGGI